jgi:hypothetical protein
MKKVRIMLASVAVLAVAGGALAFKAKTEFCAYTAPTPGACVATIPNFTTQADASATSFVTFKQKVDGQCPAANDCNNLGIIVNE